MLRKKSQNQLGILLKPKVKFIIECVCLINRISVSIQILSFKRMIVILNKTSRRTSFHVLRTYFDVYNLYNVIYILMYNVIFNWIKSLRRDRCDKNIITKVSLRVFKYNCPHSTKLRYTSRRVALIHLNQHA